MPVTTTDQARLFADVLIRLDEVDDIALIEGAVDELARTLDLLDRIAAFIKERSSMVQLQLAEAMDDDKVPIAGLGTLVRSEYEQSGWRYKHSRDDMIADARNAIAADLATDAETGEIRPNLKRLVERAVDEVVDVFSIGASPKVAFRRRYRLDPETYRTFTGTKYTVKIEEETL